MCYFEYIKRVFHSTQQTKRSIVGKSRILDALLSSVVVRSKETATKADR